MQEVRRAKHSTGQREGKPQDAQNKNNFRGSISRSEPVLDYIQDLDVRLRIFQELNRPNYAFGPLNVAVFSVLMVAPITQMEEILHHAQRLAKENDRLSIACVLGNASDGIQAFANKDGFQLQSTSSSSHDSLVSSPGPDTVYIFPLQVVKYSQFSQLRVMLRTRWNPEQADIWCSMTEQTNILESPQNLIRLDPQLHRYLNIWEMALKSLRKTDDGSVVVQFHWLKHHHVAPSDTLWGINMDEWIQRAGLADNSAWGDDISGLPVEPGQTFVLSAKGPAHVPSFELLQLSWDLLRIMAISGVAGLEGSDYSGSDGCIYHETDGGIWSEDDYAQLRSWAEGIQTDKGLENNAESDLEAWRWENRAG